MMIGPDPIIKIFLMSLRFGIFSRETFSASRTAWLGEFLHQIRELREEIVRIVRAGRGFRVVLHAEEGQFLVAHALVGVIVQIDVRDFHIARRKRVRVDAEAVILGGDFYLFGQEIFHRMIRAVMPELQFKGLPSQGQPANLMPKANPENWDVPNHFANVLDGVPHRLRVAWAVGKKDSIRLHFQNVFGGSLRGHNIDFAVVVDEQAQDVLLDSVVVSNHAMPPRFRLCVRFAHLFGPRRNGHFDGAFIPPVGLRAGDAPGEFLPNHAGQLFGFENQLFGGSAIGGDHAAQRTRLANMAYQGASIDVPEHRDLVAVQIELRRLRRAPVGGNLGKFTHDEGFNVRPRGFLIFEVRADISDVRIGQTNNLPRITWVSENFLVTGEAGIENDFAAAAHDRARRAAIKDAPVLQREYRRSVLNFAQ